MTRYTVSPPMQKLFPPSGKIKVTPEESRVVQERLFKEGYRWKVGQPGVAQETDKSFLTWYAKDKLIYSMRQDIPNHPNPEFTISLFAPVEVVDEWQTSWEDFSKTEDYKTTLAKNILVEYLRYLKSKYKLKKYHDKG